MGEEVREQERIDFIARERGLEIFDAHSLLMDSVHRFEKEKIPSQRLCNPGGNGVGGHHPGMWERIYGSQDPVWE
jgi:hypothetical protein